MDQYLNTAYDVTTAMFGPGSGIPYWGWGLVILALFWKLLVPERKTLQERVAERDEMMLGELFGDDDDADGGKKKKKKK